MSRLKEAGIFNINESKRFSSIQLINGFGRLNRLEKRTPVSCFEF